MRFDDIVLKETSPSFMLCKFSDCDIQENNLEVINFTSNFIKSLLKFEHDNNEDKGLRSYNHQMDFNSPMFSEPGDDIDPCKQLINFEMEDNLCQKFIRIKILSPYFISNGTDLFFENHSNEELYSIYDILKIFKNENKDSAKIFI